jgi:uncharacterized protein YkvS
MNEGDVAIPKNEFEYIVDMKHVKLFEEFLNEKIERFSDKENAKESLVNEVKGFNVKDLQVGTILNFKDGETWKVTKIIGNSNNPRGYLAAPFGETKKRYTSVSIEFKLDELEDTLESIEESLTKAKTDIQLGDVVEIQLHNDKIIKGKVEKISPLKVRTDSTSTQVIPDSSVKSIKIQESKVNERFSDSASYTEIVKILKSLHAFSDKIKFATENVNGIENIVYDDEKMITKGLLGELSNPKFWNTEFASSKGVFSNKRVNIRFEKSAQDILNIKDFDKKDWTPGIRK